MKLNKVLLVMAVLLCLGMAIVPAVSAKGQTDYWLGIGTGSQYVGYQPTVMQPLFIINQTGIYPVNQNSVMTTNT